MYYIGLGYDYVHNINPSSKFKFNKLHKCKELKLLLNETCYRMESILRINTLLMNNNVEDQDYTNDIAFSKHILLVPTLKYDEAVNFIKNILSKNNLEE